MATPSGSIILKPGMGKELYRIAPRVRRSRSGCRSAPSSNTTFLAAAPDGSVVAVDITGRRAFRLLGTRKQDLPLYASDSHYIYTFAVAPDGSIWVWDHLLPGFRIHTAEGTVADFVLPLLETSALPYPARHEHRSRRELRAVRRRTGSCGSPGTAPCCGAWSASPAR